MVGQAVEGMPWLGTFHAIGVKILRRHAELVGLKSDFTILDVDDQIRLLKQLLEAEGIDEKRWPARVLAGLIDHWKNRGLTPDQVPSGEAASFANGRGKKLYAAYQERLKTLNAADFGDLLLEMHPAVPRATRTCCGSISSGSSYILVDEYQDTNVAQYLWLRLIAQQAAQRARRSSPLPACGERSAQRAARPGEGEAPATSCWRRPSPRPSPRRAGRGSAERAKGAPEARSHPPKNICCVGDDDQSIYGWRGAEVDNILRFEHDFPGAKVIRLERNYRSTGHILAAASPPDRAQRRPARQDAAHRGRAGREGHRHRRVGLRGRGPLDRRGDRGAAARRPHASTRSRSWCAPRSRCASSKTASSRSACPTA